MTLLRFNVKFNHARPAINTSNHGATMGVSKQQSIYIDEDVLAEIDSISKSEKRSLSKQIELILENWLTARATAEIE